MSTDLYLRDTLPRLNAIIQHLKLGKKWRGEKSAKAVIEACLDKVSPLLDSTRPHGEEFSKRLANHLQVQFEEVHSEQDIDSLESVYFYGKREMSFALLRDEIRSPNVDALLFRRQNALPSDADRWVGVLNMTHTKDRAYWNRFHEMAHRLAEPPQQMLLPFRRELDTKLDPVEKLMDAIAGEIAFHKRLLLPYIDGFSQKPLTFETVERIRSQFAPSASFLSVTNAAVKMWGSPALAFVAREKAKKNGPQDELSLRIEPHARNDLALSCGFSLIKNMRVPVQSYAHKAFLSSSREDGQESTAIWITSTGGKLRKFNVFVSAVPIGNRVYGIMTVL